MNGFHQPEFIGLKDQPSHRIRCPIHGFIHFSENERQVLDHPLFHRLRFIRQLALTEYLYPGASHTRFEHALGVMEVATRMFDSLAARRGDEMQKTFEGLADFTDRPMAQARQALRLAALLHDVGHTCFSHAAEKVLHKDSSHEAVTIQIVENPNLLGSTLEGVFWPGCGKLVGQIVDGIPSLQPQLQVLHDIISGQMDADRTDYLLRDAYHCGVDYGRFDHRRLIECLELHSGDLGQMRLALHEDGLHSFEALILARYQMNTQVYQHRVRQVYDIYLQRYFRTLAEEEPDEITDVVALNDVVMMSRIMADAVHAQGVRRKWAARIAGRDHHRVVYSTGANARVHETRRSKGVLDALERKYPDREFLSGPASGSIHNLLLRDDREREAEDAEAGKKGYVELMLIGRDGQARHVDEQSQVIGYIPREFEAVRIFVDIASDERALLEEMRSFATDTEWQLARH
ncbi:MAG TPA: HD domain-containing protein [Armatimonadota bacterium]|nr:HD domain-containing protein [Armatimonadota bacterium]